MLKVFWKVIWKPTTVGSCSLNKNSLCRIRCLKLSHQGVERIKMVKRYGLAGGILSLGEDFKV